MLKIYNTLTNKLEEFKPIEAGKVTMYVCGPTVYNYIHIGNARPLVFFDVVYRYFLKKGFEVKYISNFTDIDDRIINQAIQENISEEEVAQKYIDGFLSDFDSLNCLNVTIRCKVTDYIDEIGNFILKLVENGFAYQVGDDVYFDVVKLSEYGKLSNQDLSSLIAGQRIVVNDSKKNSADFTLWKKTGVGIEFDSPFGLGRPGWHTECVVMIKNLTDGCVDIHGGGQDLVFPHHENEMIQSVAYDSTSLANYWMHNGMININNEKMSKSLKNVVLVKEFVEKYSGNVLRLALLHGQYRQLHSVTDELIDSCVKMNSRLEIAFKSLMLQSQLNELEFNGNIDNVLNSLEQDFNTPNLITYTLDKLKVVNGYLRGNNDDLEACFEFLECLDLLGLKYKFPTLTSEDKDVYNKWVFSREKKNFEEADEMRKILEERGIL